MIHPSAIVHPRAHLGANVSIGPYSIIGEHVVLGEGTQVGPHAVITGHTTIGRDNKIFQFVSLGEVPRLQVRLLPHRRRQARLRPLRPAQAPKSSRKRRSR